MPQCEVGAAPYLSMNCTLPVWLAPVRRFSTGTGRMTEANMHRKLIIAATAAALALPATLTPVRADVIAEDEGLYEKERWNIGKRYDNLDNPYDAPGIITSGEDPANPSGPALDMGVPSGPPGDVTGTVEPLGD
ncbi:hypothetical protein [Microvirga splendida]|uniref:Uncharacterized protein n=1 Tax=Microvirga splendida TaxID=2795727 RepID=A0ABS0Y472_9HYPH|nr:hypothetical protein [Microvirga splendida]MBJ6127094.1 hypothetical protein [Microvirga splendida]